MKKIVILDGLKVNPGDLSWDALKAIGDVTIYDRTTQEEVVDRIGDAEIIFVNKTYIKRSTLEACPNLKFIGTLSTGFNVIDIDATREAGIVVSNVPTYGTEAVAQFTLALLLELCHHIGEHSASVFKGQWQNSIDYCYWNYPLIELTGKTIGIIGFGTIGRKVGALAQAFGMNILAYSRTADKSFENEHCKFVSLDELLANSDVISLHCPLTSATEGMIDKHAIQKMKDGVLLLNSSRGQLIVEEDLREALDSGKVAGAAVDVVSKEPIQAENPLLKAKNIIITPHIAWAPKEARGRIIETAAENLKAFLAGKPVNQVNL
ncbi:MAG: D-isomer specific 2-hydroxyacid dehydrogenase NAD-binding protein [Bacillales bacterium]|jgi:glycerate dehydrogenase|nr:D-isomer specific 2-hydroxyacid dehydrogenase NAD-binding protein [Bacillales bacterium]